VSTESAFRHDLGLGSSAAVTVAALAALDALAGRKRPPAELLTAARGVIRGVQGVGSGADAAASILGGVVAYRADPLDLRRVADGLPLTVVYSGAKEKTAKVIARVERLRRRRPGAVGSIFRRMGALSEEAAWAIGAADWPRAGKLMNQGQELMVSIEVHTPRLDEIVAALRAAPGIHGAKISGSGLGDCVVGLGRAAEGALPFPTLPVHSSAEGVRLDAA
jgi:mevalonate kinase